jgi:hypothetical protein
MKLKTKKKLNTMSTTQEILVETGDVIHIRIVVSEFNFRSSETIVIDPSENDLIGKAYITENWELQINWRRLDALDSFWWEQEEKFYEFLNKEGVEYNADEYSDYYEWEVEATRKTGEQVYSGLSRG